MALAPAVKARLDAVIAGVMDARAHHARRPREAQGWDSHAVVDILFGVEEAFGFTLSSGEMEQVADRPSLEEVVARRLVGALA